MSNNTISTTFASLTAIDLDAGEVFSGKPSGTIVRGYGQACAYSPKLDNEYILHDACRDVIVWFLNDPEPLYVYGPLGSGKSSCIKQVAARLNYPVFEVTGHGRLEFADLVGHFTVQQGNMTFEYGPLSLAMRYGGLLLLNEIDLTAPEVAAGLNSILDGSPLCIAENGGELITPSPRFRFVATANSNGAGDDTGLYQGVVRQNAAFLDRFTLCEMGYPDAAVEQKLLKHRFSTLPSDLCDKMVEYANEIRKLFMGEATDTVANTIEVTFSTRSLLRWADLTTRYQPLARQGIQPISYALDRALAYRASRETRAMMHELAERIFPKLEPQTVSYHKVQETMSGQEALDWLEKTIAQNPQLPFHVQLSQEHTLANGTRSTKLWGAMAYADLLKVEWGRKDTCPKEKLFNVSECQAQNTLLELKRRVTAKIQEGYELMLR